MNTEFDDRCHCGLSGATGTPKNILCIRGSGSKIGCLDSRTQLVIQGRQAITFEDIVLVDSEFGQKIKSLEVGICCAIVQSHHAKRSTIHFPMRLNSPHEAISHSPPGDTRPS